MKALEWLFCVFVRGAWIVLLVGRADDTSDVRPLDRDDTGEACRALVPDRTILPGW